MKSQIIGIGSCVPENVVTNAHMEEWMDTSDEWIQTRSGIQERHWAVEGETASDLAESASRRAMEMAGISPDEIDLVIVGTITSDYFFPGISAQLQDRLGLRTVGAFDIKAACSAFIYALSIGDQYIRSCTAKTVLVVGAEVQSSALDISDEGRDTAVLFGDGAGAAILKAAEGERGILSTHLHCQGEHLKLLWCEEPGSNHRPRMSEELLKENRHYPVMNGREVFKNAVTRFPEVIEEAMEANNLSIDDVALIIPHQANLRISQAVAKRMGIGMDKVFSNIHKYGNTTAASIPLALCEAVEEGKISVGDNIIFAAFGAGFTWASAAVKW